MENNKKLHRVKIVDVDPVYFHLSVDDRDYHIRWAACSQKLANATMSERRLIAIAPSGYGLHWPLIDEDLAIDPLLQQAETTVEHVLMLA